MTTFDYILIGVWAIAVIRYAHFIYKLAMLSDRMQTIVLSKNKNTWFDYLIIIIPLVLAYRIWG